MQSSNELKKTIGMPQAVALYVSAVLGSGVLIVPGLAAELAGPASLLAWEVWYCSSFHSLCPWVCSPLVTRTQVAYPILLHLLLAQEQEQWSAGSSSCQYPSALQLLH